MRASFDEEVPLPLGHAAVSRGRPLTGISEGDEHRLSTQQQSGYRHSTAQQGHLLQPSNPFDDRQSIATDQLSFTSSTNVIPIAFVPSHPAPTSAGARASQGNQPMAAQTALDVARERALKTGRLKVGIAVPPSRPARSPDLDLRLNPQRPEAGIMETLTAPDQRQGNANRMSVTTTRSAAPSFFSGTSEFAATGMDAPMIMTSRQVQLGIRQAADFVHIPAANDPFSDAQSPQLRSQRSTATFGGGARDHHLSHQSSAMLSDDGRSAVSSNVGVGGGGGDLRFSMGSLAGSNLRDSISTQGTGALREVVVGEARKINLGGMGMQSQPLPPTAWQTRGATNVPGVESDSEPLPRPRPGFAASSDGQSGEQYGTRESMMSSRSDDSFLNAIIPPKPSSAHPNESPSKAPYTSSNLAQKLPTSMSTETFNSGALFTGAPSPGKPRHPSQVASPRRPAAGLGQNPLASESRHTLGLSGFEFQIGDNDAEMEELPPLPNRAPGN